MLSMEFEEFARGFADRGHGYALSLIAVQPFVVDLGVLDVRRDMDREIVVERDQPLVEGPVVERVQQQAVRGGHLLRRRRVLPWLDVAGDEQRVERDSRDAAAVAVVVDKRVAEILLVDPFRYQGRTVVADPRRDDSLHDGIGVRSGTVVRAVQRRCQQLGGFEHQGVAAFLVLVPYLPVQPAAVGQPLGRPVPVKGGQIAEFERHRRRRAADVLGEFPDGRIALVPFPGGQDSVQGERHHGLFARPVVPSRHFHHPVDSRINVACSILSGYAAKCAAGGVVDVSRF